MLYEISSQTTVSSLIKADMLNLLNSKNSRITQENRIDNCHRTDSNLVLYTLNQSCLVNIYPILRGYRGSECRFYSTQAGNLSIFFTFHQTTICVRICVARRINNTMFGAEMQTGVGAIAILNVFHTVAQNARLYLKYRHETLTLTISTNAIYKNIPPMTANIH